MIFDKNTPSQPEGAERNPIRIAFSLPAHGIKQTAFLYEQALYALNEGKRCHPESRFYDFFDYAIDYILESGTLLSSVQACMPAVLDYTSVTGKTEMNFSVHCRFIWKMNGQSPVPPKLSIRTETPCSTVSERFRICLITTCPIPIHGNTRYCPSRLCICITVKQTIIIVKHEKSGMNNDLKYVIIITQILTV